MSAHTKPLSLTAPLLGLLLLAGPAQTAAALPVCEPDGDCQPVYGGACSEYCANTNTTMYNNNILYFHGRNMADWPCELKAYKPGYDHVFVDYDGNASITSTRSTIMSQLYASCGTSPQRCVAICYSAGCNRLLDALQQLSQSGTPIRSAASYGYGLEYIEAAASAAGGTEAATTATSKALKFIIELLTNVKFQPIDQDITPSRARGTFGAMQNASPAPVYHWAGNKDLCRRIKILGLFSYKLCGNKWLAGHKGDGAVPFHSSCGYATATSSPSNCAYGATKYTNRTYRAAVYESNHAGMLPTTVTGVTETLPPLPDDPSQPECVNDGRCDCEKEDYVLNCLMEARGYRSVLAHRAEGVCSGILCGQQSPCQNTCLSGSGCVEPGSMNAEFVSQTGVPTSMTSGQTATVSLTLKNTGGATWTSATSYKLGAQNPQDNTNWGLGRVLLATKDSIALNGTKTFTFTITAPTVASPSTKNFQWQMLREGVAWFGAKSTNVAISVSPPTCSPACAGKPCGAADGCGATCAPGSGCTTPPSDYEAKGWLDSVGAGGWASGWACDQNVPAQSIEVHFWTCDWATFLGKVTANAASEQAVANQCGGGYNHRFGMALPTWANGLCVCGWAMDPQDGSIGQLGNSCSVRSW
jgi:hypothetical protein